MSLPLLARLCLCLVDPRRATFRQGLQLQGKHTQTPTPSFSELTTWADLGPACGGGGGVGGVGNGVGKTQMIHLLSTLGTNLTLRSFYLGLILALQSMGTNGEQRSRGHLGSPSWATEVTGNTHLGGCLYLLTGHRLYLQHLHGPGGAPHAH